MQKQVKLTNKEKLFHPNGVFLGDPSTILKGYPERSKKLDYYVDPKIRVKKLDSRFIKDGYMYLLRGAKNGQETGFYSKEYAKGNTITSLQLDPNLVAYAQILNGNTPFISTTTDLYRAASFSNHERIYILKIPAADVYNFTNSSEESKKLEEHEYLIPDYVSKDEIIRSFRYDKFSSIYNFLKKEVGLDITSDDLGVKDINQPDKKCIDIMIKFNNNSDYLDPILEILQGSIESMKLKDGQNYMANRSKVVENEKKDTGRKIALFTDIHALLEPTEAILEDIKNHGISEIYSLGDQIGLGPNPNEVVKLLDEYGVITLQGNYEDMLGFGVEPFMSYLTYSKIKNINWTKSQLNEEQLKRLTLSPHFINLTMAGKNIALCHFANDVRCDFSLHNSWEYKQLLDMNIKAYQQFNYTNSIEQLMEIAKSLGMKDSIISNCSTKEEMLAKLREFIHIYKNQIKSRNAGYVSYCEDPLFYQDKKLLTIQDYDMLFQGHVHFDLKEINEKTSIYSLRAAGMGYDNDDQKNLAAYMILSENNNTINVQSMRVPFDREKMEYAIHHSKFVNEDIKHYTLTR